MAAGIHLPGSNETIDLQQQVARLQALLEASRQVHSTIREEAPPSSCFVSASRERAPLASGFVTGHDFSRAASALVRDGTLAPEGRMATADGRDDSCAPRDGFVDRSR